jgi:hypothetical protein
VIYLPENDHEASLMRKSWPTGGGGLLRHDKNILEIIVVTMNNIVVKHLVRNILLKVIQGHVM